jgi:hypothetical protein
MKKSAAAAMSSFRKWSIAEPQCRRFTKLRIFCVSVCMSAGKSLLAFENREKPETPIAPVNVTEL